MRRTLRQGPPCGGAKCELAVRTMPFHSSACSPPPSARTLAAGRSVSFAVRAMLVQSPVSSPRRPPGPALRWGHLAVGHSEHLRYEQSLFNRRFRHPAVRHLAVGRSELLRYEQSLFHRQPVHSAVRHLAVGRSVSFCGTGETCFIVSLSFAVRKDPPCGGAKCELAVRTMLVQSSACSPRRPPGPAKTILQIPSSGKLFSRIKLTRTASRGRKFYYKNTPALLCKRAFILYEKEF